MLFFGILIHLCMMFYPGNNSACARSQKQVPKSECKNLSLLILVRRKNSIK
jgi:hypothetical protein